MVCDAEEVELVSLKSEDVSIKDTVIGVAANQMARAVTANLSNLDPETKALLKEALTSDDSENATRVI